MSETAKIDRSITRPEDLAKALGLKNGKVLRSYLRASFPRPSDAKGTTWVLTPKIVDSAVEHFTKRQPENA
jgi:hypothetical protein